MQRQAIRTSVEELLALAYDLLGQEILVQKDVFDEIDMNKAKSQKVLVSIVNKTSESDTWRFEE